MEAFIAVFIPLSAAALAVGFILWIKRRRRQAGKRDDEIQPLGPDGF
jgi:hypothetical protein